jgi:SAM-dependent methyltransferase
VRFTAERYTPEAADALGQEVVGLYHRFAYTYAASLVAPGHRVLDVGCGVGYGSQILRGAGAEYLGIDVDPAAIAHAKARYDGEFRLYDGVVLPEERFDLVTCFQVIEHVAEPDGLLEQIARRGVEAVFTTPNRGVRLRPGEQPWNRYHVREYSRNDLRELLARHFPKVSVSFVRGPKEIEAIELGRIARARRLARLDVFQLRRRAPKAVDRFLRARLRPATPQLSRAVSADSLWLSQEPGLDLLAHAGSDECPSNE